MKKIITIIIGVILTIFIITTVFVMRNKPEHAPEEGSYRQIHTVDGVAFSVNSDIANRATAISEISANINIDPAQYYVYKDGGNNYLLFNMSGLVVACSKGTDFQFSDNKDVVISNLSKSSVAGIWFEQNGNKLTYEYQNGQCVVNVVGGLSITNALYGDFIGQLKTITRNDEEWGIFVGVPYQDGALFKKLNDNTVAGIENIINSFGASDYVETHEEETYEVLINEDSSKLNDETDTSSEETASDNIDQLSQDSEGETEEIEVVEAPAVEDDTLSEESGDESDEVIIAEDADVDETEPEDAAVEESTEESEDVVIVVSDNETEDTENDMEEVVEDVVDEDITAIEEPGEETEASSEETEEIAIDTENTEFIPETTEMEASSAPSQDENGFLTMSNQKIIVNKSADKAYTSDIYSMLDLKDNGIIVEYDLESEQSCNVVINVERIYTGQSARDIIKDYCNQNGVILNYFEAPVGCTWHVAEYSLSYKNAPTMPYINLKVKGIDGELLKVNGITYGKRTYDIDTMVEQDGDFTSKHYVFYAIPNGWSEYCLECGTGNIDIPNDLNRAAYYKVQNKK